MKLDHHALSYSVNNKLVEGFRCNCVPIHTPYVNFFHCRAVLQLNQKEARGYFLVSKKRKITDRTLPLTVAAVFSFNSQMNDKSGCEYQTECGSYLTHSA